jgi:hypothetical protein
LVHAFLDLEPIPWEISPRPVSRAGLPFGHTGPWAGRLVPVTIVEGSRENLKITRPGDEVLAEAILLARRSPSRG